MLVPMTQPATDRSRLASVDIIRGAVMVLMAIDHVRVYSGLPAGGPTPGIFFTRWITHFCAPAFIFLAGTSAFFYGRRHAGLPRFLLTRGLWLIVLDFTVMRLGWTFNVDVASYNMAGVLWAIGWSMIALALLSRLPVAVTGMIGVVMMAAHNLLPIPSEGASALWKILYVGFWNGPFRLGDGGPPVIVLYSLIPWVGVMAAGYAFGAILLMDPERRDRICLATGLGAVAAFLVLRWLDVYGDPFPWRGAERMPAVLAFLNTNKYPASLLFLLMTLGPAIALVPLLERLRGRVAGWLTVIGRVPFFYYVLHIPLIHLLAVIVSRLRLGVVSPWLFANHPMNAGAIPAGYAWSLPLLYLVWAIAVVILYFLCRWFAGLKARRNDWWLKYL
jgi:uncharacterized membrane protein